MTMWIPLIIIFSLPGLISKVISFLGVDDLAGGAVPIPTDDAGGGEEKQMSLASLTGGGQEEVVVELVQNDMEQRAIVFDSFDRIKPPDEYIHEIKARVTDIQKKIHETEMDDEEDNMRTRTVQKLKEDLDWTCRFDESCKREEEVIELMKKWNLKI